MSMHMSLSINRREKWEMGLSLSANARTKIVNVFTVAVYRRDILVNGSVVVRQKARRIG
jgi:hypothetical protein